jgi:hypothetical protein
VENSEFIGSVFFVAGKIRTFPIISLLNWGLFETRGLKINDRFICGKSSEKWNAIGGNSVEVFFIDPFKIEI